MRFDIQVADGYGLRRSLGVVQASSAIAALSGFLAVLENRASHSSESASDREGVEGARLLLAELSLPDVVFAMVPDDKVEYFVRDAAGALRTFDDLEDRRRQLRRDLDIDF